MYKYLLTKKSNSINVTSKLKNILYCIYCLKVCENKKTLILHINY